MAEETQTAKPARLVSLDAFRGVIMIMMASAALNLGEVSRRFPDSFTWKIIREQTDHAAWAGCSLWDIIQPSFMFMVGAALAWSVANRKARGDSFWKLFLHAAWRALALVLLSVLLQSNSDKRSVWMFHNVLAQIGLGYIFLFFVSFAPPLAQWLIAFGILFFYWLAFAVYPLPPADYDWSKVGVPADWPHLKGFAAHWDKNWNFAAAFDQRFLNYFPRLKPYEYQEGGYQTLNFIPSIATMIFGLQAGALLRSEGLTLVQKIYRLLIAGGAALVIGVLLDYTGVCPMVKRIWTPSFAIYSAGIAAILLALFVAAIDLGGSKWWAMPFVVAGLNPITLYIMWQIMAGWFRDTFQRHVGPLITDISTWEKLKRGIYDPEGPFGPSWGPIMQRLVPLVLMWLILWVMYRRKIFLRI